MRFTTAMTVLMLGATAVPAGAQVPPSLHACASIANDSLRLACFDREDAKLSGTSAKANSATPNTAAVAATPAPAPAAPLSSEQSFGLSQGDILKREGAAPAKLKDLTARLVKVSHNGAGRYVFTLDNGQVWRQTEDRSFNAAPGVLVKISPGALGSYWLQTGAHNWTRIERVL